MRVKKPALTAIVCTYNPRPDLVARALRAIGAQTVSASCTELIVVDNNSTPPLDAARLERLAGRPLRVVRETRQGLTYARSAGIRAASADLLCFIDDDNEIAPDYFAHAIEIAEKEPRLGMFGGAAVGAVEGRVPRPIAKFLPFLGVRDLGAEPLTGAGDRWGPWEPIGAGLCVRRPVADGYVKFVESTEAAGGLGRRGGALLSGEDSLFSRIGDRLGFKAGYRAELTLRHHITAPRLKWRYIARLMEGHGRSYVILENICGRSVERIDPANARSKLARHFLFRLKSEGVASAVGMLFWDLGNFRQSRAQPSPADLVALVATRQPGPGAASAHQPG